ncbi:MAG TPA: hypothetical protein VFV87_09255 [Pirellulaceae bacterium]|nr:hypothetical protein [Pirellulaceae bacterium]
MQKLITIYVDNSAYGQGKMIVTSYADRHGFVEEHLKAELAHGWNVKSLHGFGGNSDGLGVRGWIVALLENPSDAAV